MRLLSFAIICWFTFQLSLKTYAQSNPYMTTFTDSSYSFAEINMYGSTQKRTPFWIQSNQFGIIPSRGPAAGFHAGLQHYQNITRAINGVKAWKIGGCIEVAANFNESSKVLLPQVFGSLRFKNWELFVGRKKQWVGLADSTIGMGSYIWSGNAMPVPRIQLGTTGFVAVPFTNNWLAFNTFYSEGAFENNRLVTSKLRLHQKEFYIRIGKPASRIRLYGGFNHQVQWGGKSPYYTINDQMPKGLKDYFYLITGKPHATGTELTHFDQTNRIGNHLGTIDLAMEINIRKVSLLFYRQNIYEDGSLYHMNNIDDGLNGIRFRRKASSNSAFQITEAVLEFLYTKSQGGSNANLDAEIRGKDDYFNNGQVRDGWSYYNRTIGTPFITPTSDTNGKWPNYSDFYTNNNRVSVWHLGIKGTLFERIEWFSKFSYSKNYGTYDVPFEGTPAQFSGILSFQSHIYLLGGLILKGSLAADMGDLYPKTFGCSLGLKKEGIFNVKEGRLSNFRY